jgi:hypothetical protein
MNVTPKINLLVRSEIGVSLNDATTDALKAVGPNSLSESTDLVSQNGFLMYDVLVLDLNNNFHGVYVDAGNGKILSNTALAGGGVQTTTTTTSSHGIKATGTGTTSTTHPFDGTYLTPNSHSGPDGHAH